MAILKERRLSHRQDGQLRRQLVNWWDGEVVKYLQKQHYTAIQVCYTRMSGLSGLQSGKLSGLFVDRVSRGLGDGSLIQTSVVGYLVSWGVGWVLCHRKTTLNARIPRSFGILHVLPRKETVLCDLVLRRFGVLEAGLLGVWGELRVILQSLGVLLVLHLQKTPLPVLAGESLLGVWGRFLGFPCCEETLLRGFVL
jgi:hypothetical protein